MAAELDHVFICTTRGGGAEAESLAALGVSEGSPNAHPGQGTACRRFFFRNAYLELLWVDKPDEAQSEPVRPLRLWERWVGRAEQACPFGFGFRPKANEAASPPFAAWPYRPAYLPESQSIPVAANSGVVSEPMLFYMPFAQRPDCQPDPKRQQPLDHAAGLREISRVELVLPGGPRISGELQELQKAGLLDITEGANYLLVLRFDGEMRGKHADLQPGLPLVLRW